MSRFRDWFGEQKFVLADGAVGTEIYARGVPRGHCYDELNVSMPELVFGIHSDYVRAGARIVTTNTFGANRFILEEYFGLGDKTRDINYRGAQLARRAAGKQNVFVAGSVGPLTRPLDRESARNAALAEAEAIFAEQIQALVEGGADLILFETFACIEELETAVAAARKVDPDLFVVAQMSFADGGLTLFGKNPYEAAAALEATGADVVGSNCGAGPQNVFEAVRKMASQTERPLCAMPNAGVARFVDGRFVYPENAEYFARSLVKMVQAGIRVVGGCCGTRPEHIEAASKALEGVVPVEGRKAAKVQAVAEKKAELEEREPTWLEALLSKQFVVGVEVDPPKGASAQALVEKASVLASVADVVNVSDSPMARPRMSPIAVARVLQENLGLEAVVHYTCRDRNVLGLHADLLGAWALGIRNILALGGDPPAIGDYPFATGVYDVTSEGLVEMMAALNEGKNLLGASIGQPTGFFVGVAASAGAGGDREIERIAGKIEKGAGFIVTQPLFDPEQSVPFFERLSSLGVPVMAGIMPMVSQRNAEYLHFEVPGISIPEPYRARMAGKKGAESRAEGRAIALELVQAVSSVVSGILIMPPTGRLDDAAAIAAAVDEAGIRNRESEAD